MASDDKEKDIRDWLIKNDPQGQEFLDRLDAAVEKMKRRAPFTPEQIRAMAEAEEACACPYCGRVVLCGPPCCQARIEQIEFERQRPILINQARKALRRVWKRAHRRFTEGTNVVDEAQE